MLDILFFSRRWKGNESCPLRSRTKASLLNQYLWEWRDLTAFGSSRRKKVASIKGAPYKGCLDPGSPITGIGFVCNIEQRCFYMLLIT